LSKLIGGEGYDAEATVSPDGKYIVFTSTRSGDLELYRYEFDTGEIIRLTDKLGYDGGAFFSRDSKSIIWRASRPEGQDAEVYKELLAQGLVEPKALNIFIAGIDGQDVRQVTDLPGANWAPFFHPDGKKVLFCSNHHSLDIGGRLFDIFMINLDGTGLEQITHSGTFDAFPMFSYDGSKLVFASNRRADRQDSRETNIFTADWVENPSEEDLNFIPVN
jgi:Tol biopolymer transport system component